VQNRRHGTRKVPTPPTEADSVSRFDRETPDRISLKHQTPLISMPQEIGREMVCDGFFEKLNRRTVIGPT